MLISAHDSILKFYLKCWRHKCKFAQKRELKQIAFRKMMCWVRWCLWICRLGDAIATANRLKWCVRVMISFSLSLCSFSFSICLCGIYSGEIISLSLYVWQYMHIPLVVLYTHNSGTMLSIEKICRSIRARVITRLLWIVVRFRFGSKRPIRQFRFAIFMTSVNCELFSPFYRNFLYVVFAFHRLILFCRCVWIFFFCFFLGSARLFWFSIMFVMVWCVVACIVVVSATPPCCRRRTRGCCCCCFFLLLLLPCLSHSSISHRMRV